MKRILFVCTGNTCRSPMAEAMLRDMAISQGLQLDVRSAGVSTVDGLPVSNHAETVLKGRNVSHGGRSTALDNDSIVWADLVLTMTTSHKRQLLQRFPHAVDKTYTLQEYVNNDAQVMDDIKELEALYSEWQMKQILGQQLSEAERARLLELEQRVPSFDIADPFGGPIHVYEESAAEIEHALRKLLNRFKG